MVRVANIAIMESPTKLWKKPWSEYLSPKNITRNGSTSTITLANNSDGKSRNMNRIRPIHILGPRWNGVNGIQKSGADGRP